MDLQTSKQPAVSGAGSIRLHLSTVIFLIAAVLSGLGCAVRSIEVVAIANEGFLIRSSRHAVLIDALFRATAPYPEFFQQGPSQEVLERMIAGEGAFASIDLALVTHADGDHFHADTAFAFLQNHPETLLMGTRDVAAALEVLEGFDSIADRVVTPVRVHGSCERIERGAIEVTACFAWHSGGRQVANNIYVVEMDGFRFLHEGDADRSPATFRLVDVGAAGLDLAFMHDWFVFNDGRPIVSEILKPRAVVLMHHRWEKAPEAQLQLVKLPEEIASALPTITIFGAELESRTFESSTR